MNRLVVFASGSGSNFEALVHASLNGTLNAQIVGLICDHADAYCLKRAEKLGIPSALHLRKSFETKSDMEKSILKQCRAWNADNLILAGYMRLIGNDLLQAYPKHILNIHPSLLPKYKGKDALGQALANGDTTLGVSVHYVDEGMDTGKIILQRSFTIEPNLSRSMIEEKLHALEHLIYPLAINQHLKENL